MKTHIETDWKAIIKFRFESNGTKLYDVHLEKIVYDNAKVNPSLPLIISTYGPNNRPTCKWCISMEDAIKHIKSFDFFGEIVIIE